MASTPPAGKLIKAAGAVAWRPGPDRDEPRVLLVHRAKYDDWSLPKGKQEPGEPLPVTAVREVFEEGGARLILGRRLISVRYQAGGRPKRVHYWSARVSDTDEGAVPNSEVDKAAWLSLRQARDRDSYDHDAGVFEDFARLPAATVPLILLRHAKALPKSGWKRDDTARPLDDRGDADATALARLLACFAPEARVITSTAVRCAETIRPYAALTGAEVQAESSLEISRTDPAASAALIADAVRSGQPTVFCAHRENLPRLLAAAARELGAPTATVDGHDTLPTAGFWVLHCADGRFVAADSYDLSDVLDSGAVRAATRRVRRRRSRTASQTASSTTAAMITYRAYRVTPLYIASMWPPAK
jgi:8-oxo-(d)GTP phosphatase